MTCTGFSHDGKYIATGDMGGGVRVWSVGERQPVCVLETTDIEVFLLQKPLAITKMKEVAKDEIGPQTSSENTMLFIS